MKKTKLAFCHSVIALILCVSMLVGTTFAWFTDSVSSMNNIIQTGRLDIELDYYDGKDWVQVTGATPLFDPNALWEPGHTQIVYLRVRNEGNLALKYQLGVNVASQTLGTNVYDDSFKLSDYIHMGIVQAQPGSLTDRKAAINAVKDDSFTLTEGHTLPGKMTAENEEHLLALVVYMPETVDNVANYKTGTTPPQINLGINLLATQMTAEEDSFDKDYDHNAQFPAINASSLTVAVKTDDNGIVTEAVSVINGEGTLKATIPAGVKVAAGVTELKVSVAEMTATGTNITLQEDEALRSMDVHVDGVAEDNAVPVIITVQEAMNAGLNMGNYTLYHVEDGVSNEMKLAGSVDALAKHNDYYYDPATGHVTLAMQSFSEVALVADKENAWEGNFDYSWYTNAVAPVDGESVTEYTIANADQLAAFGAIVGGMDGQTQYSFAGKTVKLVCDINIGDTDSENGIVFYPIGYNSDDGKYEKTGVAVTTGFYNFCGTFDGNGHTVSNFYQNTWEMKGDHNWYDATLQYYRDGMGLFGRVYGGTVKNLTVKNFSSDGEIATTGVIAAYADGATFENIAIFDCNPRVYNIGNGGIVGCVGWYAKEKGLKTTFTNITVDNSNKISALWGSYDVACGGIVGQYYPTSGQSSAGTPANGGIHFENCHIAAQMDVYNDVCANYQYYAYRYTGMLIGSVRENVTIDGHSYPKMDGITAKDCTVHFGTWNDYYYCEIIDNTTASYTHDYQMSRLTEIKAIDGTTITYLDGTTGTVPASGRANYVIVDYTKGHGTENATCYHFKDGEVWNHEDAGYHNGENGEKYIDENGDGKADLKEDKQHIYLEFNNLVTGYGWGVTSKGLTDYEGVENMDITHTDNEASVEKFEGKVNPLTTDRVYTLDEIFIYIEDCGVKVIPGALTVTITNLDENGNVTAKFVRGTGTDENAWKNGTIEFTNTGNISITIQDYYFCKATTITANVTGRTAEQKFETKFTGDFLYRVGNASGSTVALGTLFTGTNVTNGNVTVDFATVAGNASGTYNANNSAWEQGTIQFSGTGVIKITITDNDYCTPTVLHLEVVDATNVTGLSGTISGNVVLLNDCGLSSLTVSGRNTVYGNGFTATYSGFGQYLNNGLTHGVITVSENGMLDNLRIKASIYPSAYLFYSEAQKGPKDVEGTKNRYHYQLSAVAVSGNATIQNCYIYGGRNNLLIGEGNVTVTDTVLECGTLANTQIISSNEYTVTLENLTTIQYQVKATVGDTGKTMLGAAILVGDGDKDNTSATAPAIVLNGSFKQYNWVNAEDENAVSDSNAQMIIKGALNATEYNHTINGKTASNLGIIFLNDFAADVLVTNNTGLPYVQGTVSLSLPGANVGRKVYSLQNAEASQINSDCANADRTTVNALYQPQFKYNDTLGGQYVEKTDDGDEHCYREGDTIKVMFPTGKTKELDLAGLVNITKYSGQNLNLNIACKDSNGNVVTVSNNKVALSTEGTYTVTYTVTDTLFYDNDGKTYTNSIQYSWNVIVQVALKEIGIPNARFEFNTDVQKIFRSGNSNIVQFIPFLSGLKIYDYDEDGGMYLRFDGGGTESTTDYAKITSATINNVNTTGEAQGYHIVTVELQDGGKIVIDMDVRADSGSSKHSGSIKVRNNVIYVVNDGTTSGKGQTWKIYNYSFISNNGTQIDSGLVTFGTAGQNCEIATKPTTNFGEEDSGGSNECVTPDTLVTLADGTQVRVDQLTGNEELLVWNMETGKLDSAPILFVDSDAEAEYEIVHLYFSDGTDVKVIYEHGFWDYDLNKYVYLDANAADYIGHTFAKQNGDALEKVQLVDVVIETEVTTAWSPVTEGHLCYFVNGMLSMPGGVGGLFNIFEVDPETMTYDYEAMQKDIETYGLYTYEELNAIAPLSEDMFNAAGGAYLKISIGKGNLTEEELIYMINRYSKFFN